MMVCTGTKWTWRIALPEDSIHICQRALGRTQFTQWYNSWSQYHFLWHALSVKCSNKNRRRITNIFLAWAADAQGKQRRVQALSAKCGKALTKVAWKRWLMSTIEASQLTMLMRKAAQRLTGMQSMVAFSTWKHNVEEMQVYNRKTQKVLHILGYGQLAASLVAWKKLVENKRRTTNNLRKSNHSALNMLMKCTVYCLKIWQSFLRFKKRQRQQIKIGLLRLVSKSLQGWKPLRGRRKEKELKQYVICYRYSLRRCKTWLRELHSYVQKATRCRESLKILLHDGTRQKKTECMTKWRREAYGTRLYKKRYCQRLKRRAVFCWLERLYVRAQTRRITAKLAKPRHWRTMLEIHKDWKEIMVQGRVNRMKIGRIVQKAGKRDEEQFFIAWVEGARKQILQNARLRKGLNNVASKYWSWYVEATRVTVQHRAAANILFNFGEDRYYVSTFRNWQKTVLGNIRDRMIGAAKHYHLVKETCLARLANRLRIRLLVRHWQEWRVVSRYMIVCSSSNITHIGTCTQTSTLAVLYMYFLTHACVCTLACLCA